MDGWMNMGLIDEYMDGQMVKGWMDGLDEWLYVHWMDRWVWNGLMDGDAMGGWMDGLKGDRQQNGCGRDGGMYMGWADGWMWMDGCGWKECYM